MRVGRKWREGEKVKAKNERNRKITFRKKLIGQVRKQQRHAHGVTQHFAVWIWKV